MGCAQRHFYDFGNFVIDKTASGVLQAMGLNKQVGTQQSRLLALSICRDIAVDMLHGGPGVLRARGSQGRARGSEGRAQESQGQPQGSQGRAQGIPGMPGGSGDVQGIPGILFINMIPKYISITLVHDVIP